MELSSSSAHSATGGKHQRSHPPCSHCRKTEARCSPTTDDCGDRCTNCARLEQECDLGKASERLARMREELSELSPDSYDSRHTKAQQTDPDITGKPTRQSDTLLQKYPQHSVRPVPPLEPQVDTFHHVYGPPDEALSNLPATMQRFVLDDSLEPQGYTRETTPREETEKKPKRRISCNNCWKRKVRCDEKSPCTPCARRPELNWSCRRRTRRPEQHDRDTSSKRGRTTSPDHYSENRRTRSQSPGHSFYHGSSPVQVASPIESKSPASYDTVFSSCEDILLHSLGGESEVPNTSSPPSSSSFIEPHLTPPQILDPGTEPTTGYQYVSLLDDEIRLLRITPGSFESPLRCALKIFPMAKIKAVTHEFQALSYAWGNDPPKKEIFLSDLPRSGDNESSTIATAHPQTYPIRENLHQALKHIRLKHDPLWLWVDYLCIEQSNEEEKSQQIPKMPDIYSNAWNVIAWLGEYTGESEVEAVRLIPDILNLRTLDIHLRGGNRLQSTARFRSWVAFGRILQRSWFRRRWVIQEVACARKLSVRIGATILSWVDFADAVDLYSDNISEMRAQCRRTAFYKEAYEDMAGIDSSEAVALMKFSRNVFQRSRDSTIASRLMTLESLVLTASPFAVSDVRDTIYALLYLANDMHDVVGNSSESQMRHVLTSDYSKHPVDIYKDFVRYSIAKSNSLDVLYRQWASWPRPDARYKYNDRLLPSWVGITAFVASRPRIEHWTPSESLLGPVGSRIYNASHGGSFKGQAMPPMIDDVIRLDGMLLGTVEMMSKSPVSKGLFKDGWLRMLGWRGCIDEDIDDQLWRTLVANRDPNSNVAPTWYRRACALALTQLDGSGNLNSASLLDDASQPGTLVNYLKRVQEATTNRKIFRCKSLDAVAGPLPAQSKVAETLVGLGPEHMNFNTKNLVCILYGSSVPVILSVMDGHESQTDDTHHVKLVGPCYAHGHMEGEIFAGMSETEVKNKTMKFSIH